VGAQAAGLCVGMAASKAQALVQDLVTTGAIARAFGPAVYEAIRADELEFGRAIEAGLSYAEMDRRDRRGARF
jgi:hypothetical protein